MLLRSLGAIVVGYVSRSFILWPRIPFHVDKRGRGSATTAPTHIENPVFRLNSRGTDHFFVFAPEKHAKGSKVPCGLGWI